MDENLKEEAARRFSQAADSLVDACRKLEQCGIPDPPIDRLLQALDDVTQQVHKMHPPDDRFKFEMADLAIPGCRIAAYDARARAEAGGNGDLGKTPLYPTDLV